MSLMKRKKKNLPSGKALVTFANRRDQIAKEHVGFFMAIDSQAQLRVQLAFATESVVLTNGKVAGVTS